MSKKRVAPRSTMTLKDFHGGTIPSDLPLPSAPGMTVERSIFERQGSGAWMSPTLGRGFINDRNAYHRQGSSGGVRTLEDKAAYFPNPANIGRNYDEDERKPVDNRPRSSHSADRFDDHPTFEERRLGSGGGGGGGGGGAYSTERYNVESQGSLGSAPSFGSEIRISGGATDRFPPSQTAAGGYQSDIYVHEDFGLIPVGPPPSRTVPNQEPVSRPQPPSSYQPGDLALDPQQQPPGYARQHSISSPYPSRQQQTASSPPRSWRNPSHTGQSSSSAAAVPSADSVTNVWTARREGDLKKGSELPSSEVVGSPSSWRPQNTAGRMLETRALDKVSSGRWQSDASRISGTPERRQQFASPVSERGQESMTHPRPTGAERPFADSNQPRYEPVRGVFKPDSGQVVQSSEPIQGTPEDTSKMSSFMRAALSQGGRSGRSEAAGGGFPDRAGLSEEQIGSFGTGRHEGFRQRYGDDFGDTVSHPERMERFISAGSDMDRVGQSTVGGRGPISGLGGRGTHESLRISHPEGRGGFDDGRSELIDQSRFGYRDTNRTLSTSGSSGEGQLFPFEGARSPYPDRTRFVEGGVEYSSLADGGTHGFVENGRSLPGAELGRQQSSSRLTVSPAQIEVAERPKLKLLPRSKPLEKIETASGEENEAGLEANLDFQPPIRTLESGRKGYGMSEDRRQPDILDLDAAVNKQLSVQEGGGTIDDIDEDAARKAERPKLNLKPRSQSMEDEAGRGSQKVRHSVFGGARPRELVLKERGVDDVIGAMDNVQTPVTASVPSPAAVGAKWESADGGRPERTDVRVDERQQGWRYDRQDRGYERQGSQGFERQESGRRDRGVEDTKWEQERSGGLGRRELEKQDSRRGADSRHDIDKQESWRRPVESPVTTGGPKYPSSLVDPLPRAASGKYGHSPAASAVELAQAFSRSSSFGSTVSGASRGANSFRSPLSPILKGSNQGAVPGYGNGMPSPHVARDPHFSRLAEPSPPPYSASSSEMYMQGMGLGLDGQTSYFAGGKLGGYGSGELKRGSSFGRQELATGRNLTEENDDFPGKRGLPLRQTEGYYD